MFRFLKRMIFAWRLKHAVRKAKSLSALFNRRYMVIQFGGSMKVVPKQTLKELIRRRKFRKGVTIADLEKRALFITD